MIDNESEANKFLLGTDVLNPGKVQEILIFICDLIKLSDEDPVELFIFNQKITYFPISNKNKNLSEVTEKLKYLIKNEIKKQTKFLSYI